MNEPATALSLCSIGRIERNGEHRRVRIDAPYRKGLVGLDGFSHVLVLWWAIGCDDPEARALLQVPLPYAPGHTAGVFACRAPVRPNPIMTTVCEVLGVDEEEGIVLVRDIDAFDQTPVVDIKPYYGITDRVQAPRVPAHAEEWPMWFPPEGVGLDPEEG
ncbi:MAG: tRNA (adenine37-N6)-methyltransferase [Actinomycetota bacterium]|nr:tRNA (adenine37-N6)-methyltransferase [Actinomycetota bacterium]